MAEVPEFRFHPELMERRNLLLRLLAEQGFQWLSEFGSVDTDHDQYGLEVTAIRERDDAVQIQVLLRRRFPDWHHSSGWFEDMNGGEIGWKVIICREPENWGGWWFEDLRMDVGGDFDDLPWEPPAPPSRQPNEPSAPTRLVTLDELPDEALTVEWGLERRAADGGKVDYLGVLIQIFDMVNRDLHARGIEQWPQGSLSADREHLEDLAKQGSVLLVRRGAVVVGGCLLTRRPPDCWQGPTMPGVYISHLVVQPGLQGRKLGREILRCARDVGGSWDLERTRLECDPARERLLRFFHECGFGEVGRGPGGEVLLEVRAAEPS